MWKRLLAWLTMQPTSTGSGSRKPNRVDDLIDSLANKGQLDRIESALAQFSPERLKPNEQESWYHLRGVEAFRRGDRALAFERVCEAHNRFPESGLIRFSLAQEYEAKGDSAKMFEIFDSCLFPKIPPNNAVAAARYAYLWDDSKRALNYLKPILDMYFSLGIADDTFLHIRGMPFIREPMQFAAAA